MRDGSDDGAVESVSCSQSVSDLDTGNLDRGPIAGDKRLHAARTERLSRKSAARSNEKAQCVLLAWWVEVGGDHRQVHERQQLSRALFPAATVQHDRYAQRPRRTGDLDAEGHVVSIDQARLRRVQPGEIGGLRPGGVGRVRRHHGAFTRLSIYQNRGQRKDVNEIGSDI